MITILTNDYINKKKEISLEWETFITSVAIQCNNAIRTLLKAH